LDAVVRDHPDLADADLFVDAELAANRFAFLLASKEKARGYSRLPED